MKQNIYMKNTGIRNTYDNLSTHTISNLVDAAIVSFHAFLSISHFI